MHIAMWGISCPVFFSLAVLDIIMPFSMLCIWVTHVCIWGLLQALHQPSVLVAFTLTSGGSRRSTATLRGGWRKSQKYYIHYTRPVHPTLPWTLDPSFFTPTLTPHFLDLLRSPSTVLTLLTFTLWVVTWWWWEGDRGGCSWRTSSERYIKTYITTLSSWYELSMCLIQQAGIA